MPPRPPRRGGLGRAARPPERAAPLILLLHNRYRTPGGEERAVEDLAWLIRGELGEPAAVLERDSEALGPARAAPGCSAAGCGPAAVGDAVRRSGARVLHAHNVQPRFGWRALAAAREAGARVVLHLHNYRLVCAIGTCFTRGEDCTRCHGRNTLPGVRLNCRGSRAEAVVYGASLALWQRRLAESVDAFAVPSAFALGRLEELGAPLGGRARVIPSVQRPFAAASAAASGALRAGRRAADAGEGLRRRDPGLRGGRRAARGGRRRAAARGAAGAGRRRAVRRAGQRFASSPRLRARRRSPSSRRATPRSCRWPRWRRWPPGCRWSRRAPAGWRRRCPARGCTRRATWRRWPSGCGRCSGTPRPASARWPSPERGSPRRSWPAALRDVYRG